MRVAKIIGLSLLLLILTGGAADAEPAAEPAALDLYGFLRLDAVYDDSQMQHPQYVFWVLCEDDRIGESNQNHLTVYPRLTRMGVRLNPRQIGESTTAQGRVEVDFQAGGSESRERLRMRVALFEIEKNTMRFLAGQNWDLISPLNPSVHTDGVLWNAGNLGDRRPQIRGTLEPPVGAGRLSVAAALGQVGAVDGKDLDGNGRLDGSESGLPFLQVRIGGTTGWKNPMTLGVWGHVAREEPGSEIGGTDAFQSWTAGIDVLIPVTESIQLTGEGWIGENLSDLRGGIGQGVNVLTGNEVAAKGGWVQIGGKMTSRWNVYVGASIDDPEDEDVLSLVDAEGEGMGESAVGRIQNTVFYLSNRFQVAGPMTLGLELYRWETRYRGLADGTGNRVDLYFSYSL